MRRLIVAAALLALANMAGAQAQSYPSKPITVIVPFAAGGATDVLARFLGERMRAILGQPIIIENVTGAGGSIGVGRLVRAPADGYTLEMGTSTTNMLLGGLYPLQFDLLADLAPIILIASEPLMIVGKKDLPAKDLKELIAWLKANPDKASIGIPAVGGTGHLAGLSFLNEIGAKAQFIPYRGNGPALQDLVAGQIDLQIEPASNFYAQAKAGAIKPFAITSKERVGAAGDIPTTAEAGHAGLPGLAVVRAVGAEGHAEGYRRAAQRRDARGAGARGDAQALRRPRHRHAAAGPADAGGVARVPEVGSRQMVADHQGRQHQGPVMRVVTFVAWLIAGIAAASAQTFPSRPITLVVPYGPGGPADILARIMAERMRAPLGQPVIVENVAGAAGTIGVNRVVRAAPDGYTLSYGNWGTHVLNGVIQKVSYDVLTDLEPIALLPDNPYLVVTNAAVPAHNFQELLAWLKANPDKASQGTGGSGQRLACHRHLFPEPHRHALPVRAVSPGHRGPDAGFAVGPDRHDVRPAVELHPARAGRQAARLCGAGRVAARDGADIPTVDEAGLPGFHVSTWYGLWAPKGTPRDVVLKLNAAAAEALADPAVQDQLTAMGFAIPPRERQTPEAFAAHHRAEIEKWSAIIKAANVKAE